MCDKYWRNCSSLKVNNKTPSQYHNNEYDDFNKIMNSISSSSPQVNSPYPNRSHSIKAVKTSKQRTLFTAQNLSEKWGIGFETAIKTLKVTIQKFIRSAINPIE